MTFALVLILLFVSYQIDTNKTESLSGWHAHAHIWNSRTSSSRPGWTRTDALVYSSISFVLKHFEKEVERAPLQMHFNTHFIPNFPRLHASFSYAIPLPIRCSTGSNNQDPNKQSLNKIKITGSPTRSLKIRQNIPTKKQLVDYHRQGLIIEEGVGYRQTVVIRSYEVGSDKTATLESIRNLLQMNKSFRGEIMEIGTWVGAPGKNGMRRDWLIRSQATGPVFARATRGVYLNMNQHVNNVKYVRWMLETIPDLFLESHQLSSIILEYRRECGGSNIVQSLCEPDEDGILNSGLKQNNDMSPLNRFSLASEIMEGNGLLGSLDNVLLRYTHLLQTQGETKNEEIVRVKDHMEEKAI
ncbi:hypothetical protein NC651_020568 [Populus alba x Populus x berolinensis]|nr:hypothetical protein NC651_020568 [Populus alba x Populus x berolinensis]